MSAKNSKVSVQIDLQDEALDRPSDQTPYCGLSFSGVSDVPTSTGPRKEGKVRLKAN